MRCFWIGKSKPRLGRFFNRKLAANRHTLRLMRATFPAGTVSGAPKIRAMQLIADLEGTTRGPYASHKA